MFIDEVDVGMGQLEVLDLSLGGNYCSAHQLSGVVATKASSPILLIPVLPWLRAGQLSPAYATRASSSCPLPAFLKVIVFSLLHLLPPSNS